MRDAANIDSHLPPELVGLVMEQTGWWPMATPEARSLLEELRDDQKSARETAEEREGYHLASLIPYEDWHMDFSTDLTLVSAKSP